MTAPPMGLAMPIESIMADDSSVSLIRFLANLGKADALQAGFDAAHGEVIVTMDGDSAG